MKEDLNILGNEYTYVWRYPTFQGSHFDASPLDGYMLYNRICTFSSIRLLLDAVCGIYNYPLDPWIPHRHSGKTKLLSVLLRGWMGHVFPTCVDILEVYSVFQAPSLLLKLERGIRTTCTHSDSV